MHADDTGLVGEAEEARAAEQLFSLTISDFAGRVNAGKTEGLRVASQSPPQFEVPFLGEAASVKHVGALLGVGGNHTAETQARIGKTVPKLGWVASSYTQGRGAHRNKRQIKYSVTPAQGSPWTSWHVIPYKSTIQGGTRAWYLKADQPPPLGVGGWN